MRTTRLACLATLALASCAHASAPAPTPAPAVPGGLAFVDVTVVPMTDERPRAHQTVVVQGDKIVAVGPVEGTPVPPGAQVVDGRGRWLMPGLVDAHVHLSDDMQLTLLAAYGVTSVRNMWGLPMHLAWRAKVAKGELFGPRIFTTGPLTDGNPPIWDGSKVVKTADEARAAVAEAKAAGYDAIKVYNRLSPEAYDAIVAAAKQAGLPVVGHVPDAVGLERVLAAGQRSIEHLTGYWSALQKGGWAPPPGEMAARLKLIDTIDESRIPALIEAVKRSGAWNCPTLVVKRGIGATDEERKVLEARPEMRYVPAVQKASWDPKQDFRTKDIEPNPARDAHSRALDRRLVKALSDAGAPLCVGTDLGNPQIIAGVSEHEELRLLVEAGLTPYQALVAATRGPAELLGVQAEQGTVERGKRADLVLLAADPLADVGAAAHPLGVVLAGRWHDQADLAKRKGEVAAAVSRPPDRFTGMPTLPGAVTWEISFNGSPFGAERLARQGSAWVAQGATDPPYMERMSSSVLADGTLVYESEAAAGKGSFRLSRGHVEATLYDGSRHAEDPALPAGARLAPATMTGTFAVAADAATKLAVGGSADIDVVQPISPLDGRVTIIRFHVTRQPDEAGRSVHAFTAKAAEINFQGRWTIAADGLPGTIELTMKIGSIRLERRP